MRKLPMITGALVAGALFVTACGGSSTPATIPPVTIPSIARPSFVLPSLGLGSFAIPSFAGDPDLAAKFPKTINGAAVSAPHTALWAEVFALGGADASSKFAQAMAALSINPATVSFGTATVDLNDLDNIFAVRVPGGSASSLIAVAPQLAQLLNSKAAPTAGQQTIGGKSVTTLTDEDGDVTYLYASGDTLWQSDASDPDDLSAIFGALQ